MAELGKAEKERFDTLIGEFETAMNSVVHNAQGTPGFFTEAYRKDLTFDLFKITEVSTEWAALKDRLNEGDYASVQTLLNKMVEKYGEKSATDQGAAEPAIIEPALLNKLKEAAELAGGKKLNAMDKALDQATRALDAIKENAEQTDESRAHKAIDALHVGYTGKELTETMRATISERAAVVNKNLPEADKHTWSHDFRALIDKSAQLRDGMKLYATALYGDDPAFTGLDKKELAQTLLGAQVRLGELTKSLLKDWKNFEKTYLKADGTVISDEWRTKMEEVEQGFKGTAALLKEFSSEAIHDISQRPKLQEASADGAAIPDKVRGGMQI